MQSPAKWVQAYLIAAGGAVAVVPATPVDWMCYVGAMPDGPDVPDNAVATYDIAGRRQGRIQRTGESIGQPGVQIKVRASDRTACYTKIQSIALLLDAARRNALTVGGDKATLSSVTRDQPISIGPVPGNRVRFAYTLNMTIVLLPATP